MRCLLLSVLIAASPCAAQVNVPASVPPVIIPEAGPFVFGEVLAFRSAVLQQDRVLNVYLPDGYATDSARFPVVYVLDGSANEDFPHIAGLMQFMNMYELWPKSIVVGIANVDRRHDLTFPSRDTADMHLVPQAGGAAAFMDFIAQEVEPMVQARYRTAAERTVIGQSLAGLFALDVLFTRPELFDNYLIVSPSTWWDRGSILDRADADLHAHQPLRKQVFLALGTEGEDMQQNMDRLVASFRASAGPQLRWSFGPFPDEDHATILHRAVYRGFEVMKTPR